MERGTDGTEQWKEELVELHDGTAMELIMDQAATYVHPMM